MLRYRKNKIALTQLYFVTPFNLESNRSKGTELVPFAPNWPELPPLFRIGHRSTGLAPVDSDWPKLTLNDPDRT